LRRFQDETGEVSTPQLSPEILAQVNVDITF
jgi:hypothetical protein